MLVRKLPGRGLDTVATSGVGSEEGLRGSSVDGGAGVVTNCPGFTEMKELPEVLRTGLPCFEFLSSTEETVGVAGNEDEGLGSCLLLTTGWTLS